MQYRPLGNTGKMISALSFGAMRLPTAEDGRVKMDEAVELMRHAFKLGVNYVDSAYHYHGGEADVAVGKAIKGWRERGVWVCSKNTHRSDDGDEWRRRLDECLTRMDEPDLDVYLFHSISLDNWKEMRRPGGAVDAALKAKDEGLFKHLGFSCHDVPGHVKEIMKSGLMEVAVLQYNLLNRSNEPVIEYAREHGIGINVMGPIAGGLLVGFSDEIRKMMPGTVKSTAELALRFVLSNPGVSSAMSGMGKIREVEENVATASREEPLTDDERAGFLAAMEENKKILGLYCTGCNYCMPCPNGVNIPFNFEAMNIYRVWGLLDLAKSLYGSMGPEGDENLMASACVECRECEPKCPQHIPIAEKLKEVAKILGG